MKKLCTMFLMMVMSMVMVSAAGAAVTTIPNSALIPSTTYYTDDIGGGIGTALIMTGGGNASGVGSSRNDDGFSGPIPLGFTLTFYGADYNEFWANNNGNISFGGGISAFTPTGPQGASQPIISPFFADVDTRNGDSGLMYLRNDIADEIIVTWDAVGYYNQNADKLDSFQLVLRGPDYEVPAGEGQIGFFWKTMGWETGDASGGTGGYGGTPAAVGFGDGLENGQILQGSIQNGISGIVNNERLWFNLSDEGIPISTDVPEPGMMILLGSGILGLVAFRNRFKK
jgi:hypothetical protein